MKKKLPVILPLLLLLAGVYYCVDPAQPFMPRCPFKLLTGFDCPACGNQRALHQLLHLHLDEAFRYNPFLFISLPYLGALVWCQWFDPHERLRRLRTFCHSRKVVLTYLVMTIVWWVARNLK